MDNGVYVFDEYKNHKLRLWINIPPLITIDAIDTFVHKISPKNPILLDYSSISIVVELRKNLNASNYALLGALFIPENNDVLQVEGLISTNTGEVLLDNIAMPNDEVLSGIPLEYAQVVSNVTLRHKYYIDSLPIGKLLFNVGAHAKIGSSQAIFANVTRLIYRLLVEDLVRLEREKLDAIIEEHLLT
ncbi:hypothetical protein [Cohnella mopanensis]|uniref:hypothetical protein n=1 Tax=Cohnella mopanensis TaxID=2911966 RepID=UPI001EF8E882|nr:hypothetical protein [Cohnella mopanensis]